jgi:hypothetical protein
VREDGARDEDASRAEPPQRQHLLGAAPGPPGRVPLARSANDLLGQLTGRGDRLCRSRRHSQVIGRAVVTLIHPDE